VLELRLLGPLEAVVGSRPVALGSPKQRALLVQLAVQAPKAVPVERLIKQLWPEHPPAAASHAIQVYVSRLRKALGSARVVTRQGAYTLVLAPRELDLECFGSLVRKAEGELADDPAAAARGLRHALSLWRGDALADLGAEPGVREVALELEDERLRATELLIEAELALGRHARLVSELERLLVEHPAREKLYEELMLALYRSGRQADALDVYQRARANLMSELGLQPGAKLRELQAAILRQEPSLAFEPSELRERLHLPAQTGEVSGRERELSELTQLVASGGVRLVTITGPQGVGKTAIAIAAARRLAASFADGVWFVALATAAAVEPAIADTLGMSLDALRDKELLLVLDQFDHVLDAAPAVSRLLRAASKLKVLATSREPLNLYGEHRYELCSAA
jgi:DNA-binding SARP family transcriptional activator